MTVAQDFETSTLEETPKENFEEKFKERFLSCS
jgi:hypothetical protein